MFNEIVSQLTFSRFQTSTGHGEDDSGSECLGIFLAIFLIIIYYYIIIAVFSLLVHNWFVSPGVYKMLTNGHSLISPLTDVIKPLPGFRKAFKR